jgi:hypothetical protein
MNLELGFIINTLDRNAVSAPVDNSMCCGLYSCLPFHFFEIATCFLARPDFLPFLGPSETPKQLRDMLPDTVIYGFAFEHFDNHAIYQDFIDSLRNRNPIRAGAAYWIMHLMLELYWYHEVGHALCGHSDYLQATRGFNALSEADSRVGPATLRRERILLEKQADAFAMTEFLSLASLNGSMRAGEVYRLERHQVCAVRMISVLLVCFSWIWTEFRRTTQEEFFQLNARSHPPSVVRYEYLLRGMQRRGSRNPPTKRLLSELGLNPKLVKNIRTSIRDSGRTG